MATILVTDDAAFLRMSLRKILEAAGHTVFEAETGVQAIEQYKVLHPDLITMDITMPDMDGLEALSRLKEIDPNVKIIMCSAMGQQEKVVTAIQRGAADFIAKPFQGERVVASVARALR